MSHNIQIRNLFARIQGALRAVKRDRRGATTVEYIVLVAFIALGGIAAVKGLSGQIGKASEAVGVKVEGLQEWGK